MGTLKHAHTYTETEDMYLILFLILKMFLDPGTWAQFIYTGRVHYY